VQGVSLPHIQSDFKFGHSTLGMVQYAADSGQGHTRGSHAEGEVIKIYNRFGYAEEKDLALEAGPDCIRDTIRSQAITGG